MRPHFPAQTCNYLLRTTSACKRWRGMMGRARAMSGDFLIRPPKLVFNEIRYAEEYIYIYPKDKQTNVSNYYEHFQHSLPTSSLSGPTLERSPSVSTQQSFHYLGGFLRLTHSKIHRRPDTAWH